MKAYVTRVGEGPFPTEQDNEIEADKTGTVTRILGENGQAVEYGQPLFVIE